jgi:hypothetical protein
MAIERDRVAENLRDDSGAYGQQGQPQFAQLIDDLTQPRSATEPPSPPTPEPPAVITPGTPQNDLAQAQDAARTDDAYKPEKQPGGRTFCNTATHDIVQSVGGPTDGLTYPNGTTAVLVGTCRTQKTGKRSLRRIRAKWLSRDLADLDTEIDQSYKAHPSNLSLPIVALWQKLLAQAPPAKPRRGGEVWTNPHGYYNGDWYKQSSYDERIGFLQGYIGCLRTYMKEPTESYSRQPGYYDDKIWDYIDTHPKAYNEPIATMLARYRDKLKPQ